MSTERLSAALADRYRIERELGQGGMATVYLAKDLKHDRQVALKVLKPELAAVLGAERFVVEIKTTASLQHPHILPLFDSGTAEGFLFYVMPYIQGETLRTKLNRETQLSVDEAVKIASEVADALDYAHRHGVIHRDIKPENILLHDGRPMVADFGIALAVSAAAGGRMTETGLSLGTPHYMSPEQATAEKEITARSDVYSLGSVLYEMLAGQPPHLGGSAQQIIMKIITEQAQTVTALRKSVPPHIAAAIAKSIEKLPADRFASAAAFAAALHDQRFGTTGVEGVHAQAMQPSRHAWLVPALATATAIATTAALWGWMRPKTETAPITRYNMRISTTSSVSDATTMLGGRIALSADGMKLAYVGTDSGGATAASALYIRDRGELTAAQLAGTAGARRPFFKPDGRLIAYFNADGRLSITGVAGEPPRRLTEERFYELGRGYWGDDGYIYVASPGGKEGIRRIREAGGPSEVVTTTDTTKGERFHMYPVLLPNRRGVLLTVRGASEVDRIAVVNLRTKVRTDLIAGSGAWFVSGHLLFLTVEGVLMAAPFDDDALVLSGEARPLFDGVGTTRFGPELTVSASGTIMYLTATDGFTVQPVWAEESGSATLIDPDWRFISTSVYSSASLSPTGDRLVVSQGPFASQQLYVKQLPRGPNMPLSTAGRVNARAVWSSDGRSIFFVSDRSGRNQIWRQVADGSTAAQLVSPVDANDGTFTPDSAWFLYRGSSPERHIFAKRLRGDTSERIQVRSDRGEDLSPTLSPDGKWLSYVGAESDRNEIYVRPFPEVNRSKTQVSTAGGVEPRWSREGSTLFYRSLSDTLMKVSFERSGDVIIPGSPRALFSTAAYQPLNPFAATYDVMPGGRRFVMLRLVDASSAAVQAQLIVVENFVEHLKRVMKQ